MKSIIACSVVLAGVAGVAPQAHAHIMNFVFGMSGANVVPPTDSAARGSGVFRYNHHTFNYDLDLRITGVALDDLLDTGPNGTPLQIFNAPRGQTGDIVLDPGYYGDFVQDGDAIRLTLSLIRIGGQQGAFSSNIFENENTLYDGHLYIQLFTNQYPDGEIRGQLPPLFKFIRGEDVDRLAGLKSPPTRIPAPAASLALLGGGLLARRRRR